MKEIEIQNILSDYEEIPRGSKQYLYHTEEMFVVLKKLEQKNIYLILDTEGTGFTVTIERDEHMIEKRFTRDFTFEIARLSAKYIKELKL